MKPHSVLTVQKQEHEMAVTTVLTHNRGWSEKSMASVREAFSLNSESYVVVIRLVLICTVLNAAAVCFGKIYIYIYCSHNVHKYALEYIVLDTQAGDMVCLDKHTFGHARHAYRAVGVSHARHAYNAVQSLLLTECGHV